MKFGPMPWILCGPGLPPESLPHVFEKFYRVPGAPPGGTGLGLSIAYGIVQEHGGSLTASGEATCASAARWSLSSCQSSIAQLGFHL